TLSTWLVTRQPESIDSRVSQGKNGLTRSRDARFDGVLPRRGASDMSDIKYVNPGRSGWWGELDLSYHRIPVTARHEFGVEQAALAVLAAHPPVGFASEGA